MGRKKNDAPGGGRSEPHVPPGLRARAERRLAERGLTGMGPADLERLVHELQVHQIELEMQNDELQRAQSEIEESRENYVDLYDFAPVGYFSFDRNGVITEANLTGASLAGTERTNMIGKPFWLFVSPQDRGIFFTHHRETQKTARTEQCELLIQREDGSSVPVLMESMAVGEKTGDVTVRSAVTDITGRKALEDELRRYQLLARQSRDIILFVRRADGAIMEANDAAVTAYGYSREELLSLKIDNLRDPEDAPLTGAQMAAADASGILFETDHRRKDGTTFPVEVSSRGTTIDGERFLLSVIRDSTRRKQDQEVIKESARRVVEILESIGDAFFSLDERLVFTYFNAAAERLLGRDRQDVLGKPFEEVFPEVGESLFHQQYAWAAREKIAVSFVAHFPLPPYENWHEVRVYPRRQGISVFFQVVTERKRAEDRSLKEIAYKDFLLELNEKSPGLSDKELYDYVIEEVVSLSESVIGFFHLVSDDQEGVILTTWNKEALKDCAAAGRSHYPLEHAGNWVDCVRRRRPVIYNDFPNSPNRKGLPAGHVPVRRFLSVPIMEGEKVTAIFGVGNREKEYDEFDTVQIQVVATALHAIMKQRRAEEAAREARDGLEQRVRERTAELEQARGKLIEQSRVLESFFTSTITPLVLLDKTFNFIRVNAAFAKACGREIGEFPGHNHFEFYPHERTEAVFRKVVATRMPHHASAQSFIFPDHPEWGTTYWDYTLTPLVNEAGEVEFLVFSLEDVTERQRAEQQLRQAQKMEAIGTLAGGIAHDFNNMLAVIMGNAELALDDLGGKAGPGRNVRQIFTASRRAADLVRQILTFSRKTEQGKDALELVPLVKETCKLLRGSLPSTIRMKLDLHAACDTIMGDPSQLRQVVMNLCINAAHAMQGKGGTLSVSLVDVTFIRSEMMPEADMQPGAYVKLSVRDTGTGIAKDVQKRIFEPFFTTKEEGQGTGMGLAVVYGIVKSHGGAISVQSTPGAGSTFTVFLPRADAGAKEKQEEMGALPGTKETILFVDDEPALVEMATCMLENLGYEVTAASGGHEALTTFLKEPGRFDLVITDQTMPDLTGIDLARKMRKIRKDVPIILVTGHSEAASPEKAASLGISELLMKPFVSRQVAEAIRRALDRKGENR